MGTVSHGAASARRWSYVVLVLMTLAAGAMDAIAFLRLGGVFTANMTGNLILLALVGSGDWQSRALRAGLACVVFCAGLFAGFTAPGRGREEGRWPPTVTRLIWADLALQLVFLAAWTFCDAVPGPALTLALIAVASCAMGMQVAAARRVNIAGITTAFVTGTLTSLTESLVSRAPAGIAPRAVIVLALVAGALCSSLLLHLAPVWAGALPPVFVLLALVTVATRLRDLT
ncbi:YoaK family protein [Streptosporangium sp. NPDC087985]|uniref:YoaK family protein n=1 Tax=Streptosporangium sp. NPDC087985 TaxID=3366196 RepID=UPI003822F6FF